MNRSNDYIAEHPETRALVLLSYGQTGYTPLPNVTREQADKWNAYHGHKAEHLEAALICSMFGTWKNFYHMADMIRKQQEAAA